MSNCSVTYRRLWNLLILIKMMPDACIRGMEGLLEKNLQNQFEELTASFNLIRQTPKIINKVQKMYLPFKLCKPKKEHICFIRMPSLA
jgi:hypothetical protein